jgi:hypothetical protein|tara:strand:- start:704 stop:892 length:189 start_codon:yes stop_codon:yes gene_type:complete
MTDTNYINEAGMRFMVENGNISRDPFIRGQFEVMAAELSRLSKAIKSSEARLKKQVEELRGY